MLSRESLMTMASLFGIGLTIVGGKRTRQTVRDDEAHRGGGLDVEEVRAERVVQLAEAYLDRTPEELLWLLESNWASMHPRGLPQTRGRKSYWIRVRDDLLRRLKQHSEAVSVSTGLVVSDALGWAAENGYNGHEYELIIALVVALTTKAALNAAPPHDYRDDPAAGGQDGDHRST